ncbi:MAG: VanW family protein [Chloroflexi bacterium]|nr:VanW family protein [Chloroflexota bacterium]
MAVAEGPTTRHLDPREPTPAQWLDDLHARHGPSEPPRRPIRPASASASGWVVALLAIVAVGVISPVAALGMYQYVHVGRVYQGVSVLGVDLSGLTPAEAEPLVAARGAELTARPVTVRAGQETWRTDWGKLGLTMPVGTLVERAMAVGRQGSLPDQLYAQARALRGGRTVAAEEMLDPRPIETFVQAAAERLDRPMRNARLDMLPDLSFQLTSAQVGQRLDQDEGYRRMLAAAQGGLPDVELPLLVLQPQTTDEMRLPARARAEAMISAPVELRFAERSWAIDRAALAEMLVFSGGPGVPITVQLDAEKLRPHIDKIARELYQEPRNADVVWANGALKATTPSQDGRKLDVEAAMKVALEKIDAGQREVPLVASVTKPDIDSNNLAALGVKELIESATTSFAGSVPQKQHNVKLAASRLNNKLIKPGEKFSFNKALGPTTIDNGFQVAFGITSGPGGQGHQTVPSVAGGICQVATTLFQPVFWSGLQLEERHWHLYWIPAYNSKGVVGLDATVDEEVNLDLQFVNNTGNYLLIASRTDDTTVTFELYGTKPGWDVKVDGPKITDQKQPDTTPVVEQTAGLPEGQRYAVEAAREGFTATFVRTVTAASAQPRVLKLESKYAPSRNVTLVGTGGRPPSPTPAPSGSSSGFATP